jgi:predicted Zn finger-like uncharacterized protein
MIVTCPECSTRYLVDPQSMGQVGRSVRCANCGHTWHQTPPAPEPRPEPVEPEAAAPLYAGDERMGHAEPQRPRRRYGAVIGLVLLILIVGLVAGAVLARNAVVTQWPAAARFYEMIQLPVHAPGSGLVLRNVQPSRATENGLPTLVIQGEVLNTSQTTREVPKLKVVLRDSRDQELQSWDFSATDEPLAPGASVPFRTSVAQPNEAATGVLVTLAGGGS